jgi:hypothetical protein
MPAGFFKKPGHEGGIALAKPLPPLNGPVGEPKGKHALFSFCPDLTDNFL